MLRFITKTSIFALLVLGAVFYTEMALMDIPNEYSQKRIMMERHGSDIKTLILGHSQAYHGLDPDCMGDSVYNLAFPLQMPYYDYELLKRHISEMPNLKIIIWPLSDFFGDLDPHFLGYFDIQYRSYLICMWYKYLDIPPIDANRHILWSELLWSHWKGAAFTSILSNYLGWEEVNMLPTDNGWFPQYGHAQSFNTEDSALTTNNDGPEGRGDPAIQRENIEYARMITQLCREHHIQLIVITPPCHISHNINTAARDLQAMDACLKVMKAEDGSVLYFDYARDSRFDTSDFFDSFHLNTEGAAKFSTIVKNETLDAAASDTAK